MKGKMTIELTDVNTGKKETVYEENLVTDALKRIVRPFSHVSSPSRYFNDYQPLYATFLGGLLCFDHEIEESKKNLFPPIEAKLTGCAVYGQQNNTRNKFRGGYNQTESKLDLNEHYMKYVYDFATSQANGEIACVCLTSWAGGYTSYGGSGDISNVGPRLGFEPHDTYLGYTGTYYTEFNGRGRYYSVNHNTNQHLFVLDYTNDYAYYFQLKSKNSITILKRHAHMRSFSVLEHARSTKSLAEEIQVEELKKELPNDRNVYNFDPTDKALYILSYPNNYTINVNASFIITKIKFDTWKVTQYEMTNTADTSFNCESAWVYCADGKLFFRANNEQLYSIEIGNSANVIKYNRNGFNYGDIRPTCYINGRLYLEGYDWYLYILDTDSQKLLRTENPNLGTQSNGYFRAHTPVLGAEPYYFCDYNSDDRVSCNFMIHGGYLATINNLSEPVTKTADKTMKITYIIQEEDESAE